MQESYEIRESARAKRLALTVSPDGRVTVTKPVRVSVKRAEQFAEKHEAWILEAQEKFRKLDERKKKRGIEQIALPRPRKNSKAYKDARAHARALVMARLKHFNETYGFRYGTISIRDQKTRWGSCSAAGNLSFNYRLVYLPERLQDYIVVHELCHTKEHNHAPAFWAQMARALPEHASLRKELRTRYAA
ncbi:MAG: SprT family zinc-dependent metalloprotease [Patescibacteria group bacterium]